MVYVESSLHSPPYLPAPPVPHVTAMEGIDGDLLLISPPGTGS